MTEKNMPMDAQERQPRETHNTHEGVALPDNESMFRTMIEDMPALICRFRPDGTLTFVNHAYCEYFGKSHDDLIGSNFFQFIPETEREKVAHHFHALTPDCPLTTYNHHVITPESGLHWQRWTDRALFDPHGEVIEYQSVGYDITEQKRLEETLTQFTKILEHRIAQQTLQLCQQNLQIEKTLSEQKKIEDALRKSESRYRTFIDSTSDLVFLKDDHLRYVIANRTLAQFFDLQETDIYGKTDFDLLPPADARQCRASDEESREQNTIITTEEHVGQHIFETLKFPVSLGEGRTGVGGFIRDISEKKRIEIALKQNEEKYRIITDNISDIVWTMDLDYVFTFISPSVERILGYTVTDAMRLPLSEMLSPASHERVRTIIETRKAQESGRTTQSVAPVTLEIDIIDHEGAIVPCEVSSIFLRDEENHISGIIGVTRDISQRKKDEEELRASEERYRLLFHASPAGIFQYDTALNVTDCNERFAEIVQMNRTHIIGLNMKTLRDQTFMPPVLQSIAGKEAYLEGRYRVTHSSAEIWACMHTAPLCDCSGTVMGGIGIVQDVTERKQMEDDLRDSEQRFRAIFETAEDSIFLKDCALRYTLVNPTMERLFGIPASELIGKRDSDLFDAEAAQYINNIDTRVLAGEIVKDEHAKPVGTDMRTFHFIKVPMRNALNTITGIYGIARDITERKKAEEKLKIREQELHTKSHYLEEANTTLKVLLEHRENDRHELEGAVLRNVKQLIMPYIELIKKNQLNESQRMYMNILESNLNTIISPFLQNINLRHFNLTPKELEVAHLVKEGKATKEIADLLHLSRRAIEFHRDKIRHKLGLKNKKVNLRSYLLSLS